MEQTKLESIIKEEPLLLGDISHAFIDWESLRTTVHPSLFFGVGLCTNKAPAVAIPFDILSFFLLAEKLRRELELDKVFVLIADEHAKTNAFMTDAMIQNLTHCMQSTFTTVIRNLRLTHFQILKSSQTHQDSSFQFTLNSIQSLSNEYLRKEIADLTWFTRTQNVRLKLGWSINNDPIPQGHDERFFDTQIRDAHALPLSFLHCKAGRTFDPHRLKVSPYISIANEQRILLSADEQVRDKMVTITKSGNNREAIAGVRSHLSLIVRLFESLFIRIPKQTLEEKVQFIIDLSTHS